MTEGEVSLDRAARNGALAPIQYLYRATIAVGIRWLQLWRMRCPSPRSGRLTRASRVPQVLAATISTSSSRQVIWTRVARSRSQAVNRRCTPRIGVQKDSMPIHTTSPQEADIRSYPASTREPDSSAGRIAPAARKIAAARSGTGVVGSAEDGAETATAACAAADAQIQS
jgi:hypothetical protein